MDTKSEHLTNDELIESIRRITSDYRYNEFEPDSPIQHCRLNKKMVKELVELVRRQEKSK